MNRFEIRNALKTVEEALESAPEGDRHIVVLDRGWIFVGDLREEDGKIILSNCVNVRKWTQGGFGGLTKDPRGSGAVLDQCEPISFHKSAVIFMVPVVEDWPNE
jgi:hypothetical protein